MPGLRAGTEDEIIQGMYLLQEGAKKAPRVNLLGSGTILRETIAARDLLDADWGVAANSGAARASTSWRATARTSSAGTCCTRPSSRACRSSPQQLEKHPRPVIASTDYMKNYAEQIRAFLPKGRDLQGARHRRLWPQRLPHQAARALRGEPALHRRRGAEGAGRGGQRAGGARSARRSSKYGIDAEKINPLYA